MADDNEEKKENEFEKFKKLYVEYVVAKNSLRAETADERVSARAYATSFFENLHAETVIALSLNNITRESLERGEQNNIDRILVAAGAYTTARLRHKFNPEGLEAIVNDAPKEKLVKKFDDYEPAKIKDNSWHNERADMHRAYFIFKYAELGDKDAQSDVQLLAKEQYISKGLDQLVDKLKKDPALNDGVIKIIVNALVPIYRIIPVSKEILVEYIESAQDSAYKKLSEMFKNDEEKARYARANIVEGAKRLMQQGMEGYEKAAQMVYSIDAEGEK
jgi:hypothetical protein